MTRRTPAIPDVPGLGARPSCQNGRVFSPGSCIVLRNVRDRRVRYVEPAIVVADDDTSTSLYRPAGTPVRVPGSFHLRDDHAARESASRREVQSGTWELFDATWEGTNVLLIARRDEWFSTWLFWAAGTSEFLGYYVNFEVPWERTSMGFDTADLCLDLVVDPALSWKWKDDADFHDRVDCGLITPDESAAVEESIVTAQDMIVTRTPPFDGSLTDWKPNPNWLVPPLPAGADHG